MAMKRSWRESQRISERKRRLRVLPLRKLCLEQLEERVLLSGAPHIVLHDLPSRTPGPVSGATLTLSEPVVGTDARDPSTYELLDLGPDRALGGNDDRPLDVLPSYTEGSTQIDLEFRREIAGDLENWTPDAFSQQYWQLASDGTSVVHSSSGSGFPSYFVSDFSDGNIEALIRVETSQEDNFLGLVFGYGPDSFYALTWKQSQEARFDPSSGPSLAEEGLKLLRISGVAGQDPNVVTGLIWNGETSLDGRVKKLASRIGIGQGFGGSGCV